MDSKNCTRCNKLKPIKDFCLKQTRCRACQKELSREYRKTKEGVSYVIYHSQIFSSKQRRYPLPNYSLKEFREWLFSQPIFHDLYDLWVNSGYNRWLKPSCDRINDYMGYSLDVLQIMTWKENSDKGKSDRVVGNNNKASKGVVQLSPGGEVVGVYHSQAQAYRETGVRQPNINKCCNGVRPLAGGFKWEYA